MHPRSRAIFVAALALLATAATAQLGGTGKADISLVADLHDSLQQLIEDKPARVILDSQDIETVDTAILQTLCAFILDADQADIEVGWSNVTDVVCQSAHLLGLAPALNLKCVARID